MFLKLLGKIPIFGVALIIVNSYVWGGNLRADERFAPTLTWVRVLAPGIAIALALAAWILWPIVPQIWSGKPAQISLLSEFSQKPGQLAISVLPTILGFGIGVYALIFALSENLLNGFHIASSKSGGSALAINSDMAYPLLVMVATIFCSLIQQRFPQGEKWLILNWFLLFYALVLTLSLITSLFRLGEVAIIEKIKPP